MSTQFASERAWLVRYEACGPALDWLAEHGLTLEEAWHREDVPAEWQAWLAWKAGVPVRSLARAAYGLAVDVQDLAPEKSREALAVVGRWLAGEPVSVVELREAAREAWAAAEEEAAREAARAAAWAAAAAREAAREEARGAAWAAAAAREAARAAARGAAAWAAAWAAEAAREAARAAAWAAAAAPGHRARHAQIVRDAIPWEEVARGIA